MQTHITIMLQSGKSLLLNVESLKNYFDSSEGELPSEMSQLTLDAFTSVCKIISEKNPTLAEHLIDVATLVLANSEVV